VPQLQQSQSLLVVVEVWEEEEWEVFLLEECHNSNPEEEESAQAESLLPLLPEEPPPLLPQEDLPLPQEVGSPPPQQGGPLRGEGPMAGCLLLLLLLSLAMAQGHQSLAMEHLRLLLQLHQVLVV